MFSPSTLNLRQRCLFSPTQPILPFTALVHVTHSLLLLCRQPSNFHLFTPVCLSCNFLWTPFLQFSLQRCAVKPSHPAFPFTDCLISMLAWPVYEWRKGGNNRELKQWVGEEEDGSKARSACCFLKVRGMFSGRELEDGSASDYHRLKCFGNGRKK